MAKACYNVFDEMYKRKSFTWSDGVKKGRVIAISGTVATDENHRTLHKGDLEAQMRYIYESVKNLLEKMGASMDDVIKTTDYITPSGGCRVRQNGRDKAAIFQRGELSGGNGCSRSQPLASGLAD